MLFPEIIPSLTKIHDRTVLFFVDDMNLWRYILSVIFFYSVSRMQIHVAKQKYVMALTVVNMKTL